MFGTRDLIVVLPSETDVGNFQPVVALLEQMPNFHALILTAQSGNDGYVLRYFAPKIGIPEDLATGSAHCSLAPYWFSQLQTKQLTARQLSKSGGYFQIVGNSDDTFWLIAETRSRSK
jgi:predicted PhzF superfamily epimerase YddE/YHI9